MNTHTSSLVPPILRSKTTILDKSLSRGKQEVSLAAFALLFSEIVQYCQVSESQLSLYVTLLPLRPAPAQSPSSRASSTISVSKSGRGSWT